MNQFKNPVYTTSQRRFVNLVNAVDCSQQRIHLTEFRTLPPSASGATGGNTRMTGFSISLYPVSLNQVETFWSRSRRNIFFRLKNFGSPSDLYILLMYLVRGRPKILISCNIGPLIAACDHRKTRNRIVSSSSFRYLTKWATYIAPLCQIGQLCATHFAGGL